MTAIDLDAIRARAEAATPGPWREWTVDPRPRRQAGPSEANPVADVYERSELATDAEFIAHAREDIPALLAEIDRLSAELDRQQQAHGETVDKVMADGWNRVADEFDADALPAEFQDFALESEVTITVTGRVVYADVKHGAVCIEYLNDSGFPDRIVVRQGAKAVTVEQAPPPTAEELARRERVAKLIADAFAGSDR